MRARFREKPVRQDWAWILAIWFDMGKGMGLPIHNNNTAIIRKHATVVISFGILAFLWQYLEIGLLSLPCSKYSKIEL